MPSWLYHVTLQRWHPCKRSMALWVLSAQYNIGTDGIPPTHNTIVGWFQEHSGGGEGEMESGSGVEDGKAKLRMHCGSIESKFRGDGCDQHTLNNIVCTWGGFLDGCKCYNWFWGWLYTEMMSTVAGMHSKGSKCTQWMNVLLLCVQETVATFGAGMCSKVHELCICNEYIHSPCCTLYNIILCLTPFLVVYVQKLHSSSTVHSPFSSVLDHYSNCSG